MNITENVMLANLPEKIYHSDPTPILEGFKQSASFSSSMASDILTSTPYRAMLNSQRLNPGRSDESSDEANFGKIGHDFVLRNGQGTFEIAPFDSWRTNDSKAVKASIIARGLIPLNESNGPAIRIKLEAMRSMLMNSMKHHEDFPKLFDSFKAEISAFTYDGEIWNRARFDLLSDAYPEWVFDYKTTGLEFDAWERDMWTNDKFLQPFHYRKTYEEAIGKVAKFAYVVQQTFEPFDFVVIVLDDSYIDQASERYFLARERFIQGIKTGVWSCEKRRIRYSVPPTWTLNKWELDAIIAKEERAALIKAAANQQPTDIMMAG